MSQEAVKDTDPSYLPVIHDTGTAGDTIYWSEDKYVEMLLQGDGLTLDEASRLAKQWADDAVHAKEDFLCVAVHTIRKPGKHPRDWPNDIHHAFWHPSIGTTPAKTRPKVVPPEAAEPSISMNPVPPVPVIPAPRLHPGFIVVHALHDKGVDMLFCDDVMQERAYARNGMLWGDATDYAVRLRNRLDEKGDPYDEVQVRELPKSGDFMLKDCEKRMSIKPKQSLGMATYNSGKAPEATSPAMGASGFIITVTQNVAGKDVMQCAPEMTRMLIGGLGMTWEKALEDAMGMQNDYHAKDTSYAAIEIREIPKTGRRLLEDCQVRIALRPHDMGRTPKPAVTAPKGLYEPLPVVRDNPLRQPPPATHIQTKPVAEPYFGTARPPMVQEGPRVYNMDRKPTYGSTPMTDFVDEEDDLLRDEWPMSLATAARTEYKGSGYYGGGSCALPPPKHMVPIPTDLPPGSVYENDSLERFFIRLTSRDLRNPNEFVVTYESIDTGEVWTRDYHGFKYKYRRIAGLTIATEAQAQSEKIHHKAVMLLQQVNDSRAELIRLLSSPDIRLQSKEQTFWEKVLLRKPEWKTLEGISDGLTEQSKNTLEVEAFVRKALGVK